MIALEQTIQVLRNLQQDASLQTRIESVIDACIHCLQSNRKILFAGNGGSAADAQHLAAELVGRYGFDRPGLPAIALTTDTSILTAIGNDYSYDYVFARQIEALGQTDDVFFAISTSGNSKNIVAAIEAAQKKGIHTVGLTGESGGKMRDMCSIWLGMPSADTPRIQEALLVVEHYICEQIERRLFA